MVQSHWTRALTAVLGMALGGVVFVPALDAQEPTPSAVQEVTADQLESFAKAYLEVQELRERMQAELDGIQDPEEAQAVQQRASQQMAAAVEEEGLTPREYSDIGAALNQDAELRARFERVLEEVQSERMPSR